MASVLSGTGCDIIMSMNCGDCHHMTQAPKLRKRIEELELELRWTKLDLSNLLSIILEHDVPTDDCEDSCIRCAQKRLGR